MSNATDPRGCAGTWHLDDGWSGSPSSDGPDIVSGFEFDNPTWIQLGGGLGGGSAELRAVGTDNRIFISTNGLSASPSSRIYTKSKSFAKSDPSCSSSSSLLYDCINGDCTPNTTYSTPGIYKSLADCNLVCGGATCPNGQSCFDPSNLPCPNSHGVCPPCGGCATASSCPSGQTCQLSTGEDVNFVTIAAPIFLGTCDALGNPMLGTRAISVIQGTEQGELLQLQQLAQIEGNSYCNAGVGACPDGWQIRPEYHRPQVIYQFAQIDKDGKIVAAPMYKITVPHHIADKPTTPLPNYQRGNWETIFVLKDNSRVTIHSLNEANGTTMLNAIKLRIDPQFLVGSYLSKSSLVVTDNEIAQINVKNRMAKYFSTGAKNELPDWIVKW